MDKEMIIVIISYFIIYYSSLNQLRVTMKLLTFLNHYHLNFEDRKLILDWTISCKI